MATVAHADTLALSFSAYYSNTFITIGEESAGFRIRAAFLGTNHCPRHLSTIQQNQLYHPMVELGDIQSVSCANAAWI